MSAPTTPAQADQGSSSSANLRLMVAQAKKLHRASISDSVRAAERRAQRDELIVQLRTEDPSTWTYARLGAELGCSPELIALIMRKAAEAAQVAAAADDADDDDVPEQLTTV